MKILFLSDDFPPKSYGGAGIVAFNLALTIREKGHEVFGITTTQDKSSSSEYEFEGVKIFRIYADFHVRWTAYLGLYNPQTVKNVEKIIKNIKPHIVHCHNIHRFLSYHCLKIAKKQGAKVFLTAHDAMSFHYGKLSAEKGGKTLCFKISPWRQFKTFKKRYNPFRNIIIRHYFNKYIDRIFAVSDSLKRALNENKIRNVTIIHNGIDISAWEADEQSVCAFKDEMGLSGKKPVLFGGRLSQPKGGERIIQAMQKVVPEIPEAVLLVMGKKDNYSEEMLKLAEELKIDKNIVFTGWISGNELISCYRASDVIAVPSIYLDPFPTINLEAMACVKPVVGTCFGGTKEVVENDVTGYIVNPFDTSDLAKKIVELLKNLQKAKSFGEAGYERIVKYFSLEKQAEAVLGHYHDHQP